MKQATLFKEHHKVKKGVQKYSGKIEAPVYEPKNEKPHILSLFNNKKARRLITEIDDSTLPEQEKRFLREAAMRHVVFNYELIADYYAHASKEMQHLMGKSALVIIDFERAIEYGYVKLCSEIRDKYLISYDEEE